MTHPRWDPAVVERVARGILTASYPDLTWDSDLDHDDQVYMRRLAGAALDTLDEMGCLTPSGQRQPLAWSLPTEPGPEVTAVRAARPLYGLALWRRAHTADLGHHWQLRSGPLRVQSPRGTCTRCRCDQWDIDTAAMLAAEHELREARLAAIYADERLTAMIRRQP